MRQDFPMLDDEGYTIVGVSGSIVMMPYGFTAQDFAKWGEEDGPVEGIENLMNFGQGHIWDLQRESSFNGVTIFDGGYIDAATIVMGIYAASANIPESLMLTIQAGYGHFDLPPFSLPAVIENFQLS